LGTVRDLATHDSQTQTTSIANHRRYDSFGNLLTEPIAAVDTVFGYTGRLWDEATQLQNNLHRWYDPVTGRWLSEDPIGILAGDTNFYRYVGNSPLSFTDPSGLIEFDWGASIYGGAHSLLSSQFPILTQAFDESFASYQDMYNVWNNSAPNFSLAERAYMTAGTGAANLTGVRGASDLCSRHDAISGREQSATERAVDGIGGAGRLGAIAGAGLGALRAASTAPVTEGIYEFHDQTAQLKPYVGQSANVPNRLGQHVDAGRLIPGTAKTTAVPGGKLAREIAEHNRIQQLTGGQRAKTSSAVANKCDPIGPKRRETLGLPHPRE
jgi:RHS repeat-associated protein